MYYSNLFNYQQFFFFIKLILFLFMDKIENLSNILIIIIGIVIRHFEKKRDKKKQDNFRNGYK